VLFKKGYKNIGIFASMNLYFNSSCDAINVNKQRILHIFEDNSNVNLDEDKYIIFSCGHKICQECLIKDLLLLQFKNLENKDKIQFIILSLSCQPHFMSFREF